MSEEIEAPFRVMADHAPVMLWMSDTTGECVFFNEGWLAFTGRPMEAELGVGWAESVHFEDFQACMRCYLASFVARRTFRMEYRMRRSDGQWRWILDHGTPRYAPDGSFRGFIGSCIDVTEFKNAQLQLECLNGALQTRIAEREVLVREIHHRVKNNLQIVSSILNLHAEKLDESSRRVIREGQDRIRAIALVHEKLSSGGDLAQVQFHAYIRDLVETIHVGIGAPNVSVEIDARELCLAVDRAVPCGLMVNELVTNALRHAFPDRRRGHIHVGIEHAGETMQLTVSDDGIGLGDVDPLEVHALGFDIVRTMARQLGGRLEVVRGGGTAFHFSCRVGDS